MSVYHATYTFHLHTPSSYLLYMFSPVVTVNVLHHISHHTTVITLHVWVTMGYHCICLYTTPPTHSTFTLPPLISSPDSDLWPRSTYYITYHTTLLLSHYTFGLQWGITVYVCIQRHLHIPSSKSLILSPFQVLTCGDSRTAGHGHGHDNDIPRMTPVSRLHHVAVQQVRDMTYLCNDITIWPTPGK